MAAIEVSAAAPGASVTVDDEALSVLKEAVANLVGRKKQPRAAGVKSEMQRIIAGDFDQAAYGYGTFRDFVDHAKIVGVVDVSEPPEGGDPLITLPGQTIPESAVPSTRRRARIRPDIWRAFTAWDDDYTRAWDARTGQVLMFPTDPRPLEPLDLQNRRTEVAANPDRYLQIEVVTEEKLIARMKSFVDSLDADHGTIEILRNALQQSRPARAFTAAARSYPDIAGQWKKVRFDFIRESIVSWQERNGIHGPIEDTQPRRDDFRGTQRTSPPQELAASSRVSSSDWRSEATVEATRDRILAALARMPLSELLRLRVPVEYLLDR